MEAFFSKRLRIIKMPSQGPKTFRIIYLLIQLHKLACLEFTFIFNLKFNNFLFIAVLFVIFTKHNMYIYVLYFWCIWWIIYSFIIHDFGIVCLSHPAALISWWILRVFQSTGWWAAHLNGLTCLQILTFSPEPSWASCCRETRSRAFSETGSVRVVRTGQLNGLFLFNPDFLFGSTTVVSDAAGKICCCWTSGEQDGSDPPYTCRIWLRCGNRDQEYLYTLT